MTPKEKDRRLTRIEKKAREILDMMGDNPQTINQRLTRLEKIFNIKKKSARTTSE